ncbi:hypoxanthine-guanine phosphoribosyltransferase [Coralloluteibacterium stylophorae]|uniref:Hypoxanthine-guanine phosphoribosyltransferase n=1 Tax=Coralloluteibacterium stylophorae TaxID=1776034 RepID=A0A8J7VSP7_9GAMM|nr:hypoxanthine-guanine phosphoribosyltransferase [Coralloluteibacterium stylophorae]MBS7458624.1 hypoxanthine-guanine phosphoribosyltransferase [Coralloluteibacterium stylophorae]
MDHDIKDALARADLLFDRAAVEAAIARMGAEIARDYAGDRPLFLTVMNGALPFAGLLALAVGEGADLQLDYVHATRYRGATSGGELHWLHRPASPMAGRRVLLVDDILDEGHTLDGIRRWCLAEGAAEVRIAAMTVKAHDRAVAGVAADYVGIEVPDRYVFGFGMDYHEQGRNLPGIYALRDTP